MYSQSVAAAPLKLAASPETLVLDTNIVLDLWLFNESALAPLKNALQCGQMRWLATDAMRAELARVLAYPQLKRHLPTPEAASAVLGQFDSIATCTETAPRAPYRCQDPDDQIFIDLALAHRAVLLSKDKAVLSMRKRLEIHGVSIQLATVFVAKNCPL